MEQYKDIIKQTGLVYLVKFADFALTFFLFITLTRLLSQSEFGIYSILSVTLLFIVSFLDLGVLAFSVKSLTGKSDRIIRESFSKIFTFVLLVVIASNIIMIPAGYFILKFYGYSDLFYLTILIIMSSDIIILGNLLSNYMVIYKKTGIAKFIEFLIMTFWAFPLMLIAFFYINVTVIFITKFIASLLIFTGIIVFFKLKEIKFFGPFDWDYIKQVLIFGLPLTTLVISNGVIGAADRYLLGFFHSSIIVAEYAYIYTILNIIFVFVIATLDVIFFPFVAEAHNQNKKSKSNFLLNGMLKYSLIITIPALVGFYILSTEIITMISGDKYISAIGIIPFLIMFPLAQCFIVTFMRRLQLEHRTKSIAIAYFIGMVLNLALNFLLIPKYYTTGAGIATSITYTAIVLMLYLYTRKHIQFDYNYLKIGGIIISTIVMALSIMFIHPGNIVSKIFTVILGAAVYLAGLFVTNTFVKEEKELFYFHFLKIFKRKAN